MDTLQELVFIGLLSFTRLVKTGNVVLAKVVMSVKYCQILK